jgi:hypothetical protein
MQIWMLHVNFRAMLCGFSFKVGKKWLKVLIRSPQTFVVEINQIRYQKTPNFMLISERLFNILFDFFKNIFLGSY